MKQTAVEWFFNEIKHILPNDFLVKYEQADKMFEEQIIQARITSPLLASIDKVDYIKEAEQYYNETFKSE